MMWILIRVTLADGSTEWQVSDGVPGDRSTSYDFSSIEEALDCLRRLTHGL